MCDKVLTVCAMCDIIYTDRETKFLENKIRGSKYGEGSPAKTVTQRNRAGGNGPESCKI